MIDLTQTPNMFRMVSGVERRQALDQADLNAMKLAEAKRTVANRNAMGAAVQQAGGDYTAGAKNYLANTGDVEGTLKLEQAGQASQDRQRAEATKHIDIMTKLAPVFTNVVDQASWDAARQAEAEVYKAYGETAPQRPESYDEAAPMLEKLRTLRQRVAGGTTAGGAEYVQTPDGKITFAPRAPQPKTPPETWSAMSDEQRKAYGVGPGDVGQISSRGQAKVIRAKGGPGSNKIDAKGNAALEFAKAAGFSPSQQQMIGSGVASGLIKLQADPLNLSPPSLIGPNGPITPPQDATNLPVGQRKVGEVYSNGRGGFARWTGQGWQPE